MKTYKKILLTVIVSGSCLVSQGQQFPDSLLQYLEIAAKNNPAVLQKFTEYQIALQKIPQVGSLSDPELSLGVFLKPMELVSGNQVADIRLMQMFPWFGVLKNAKDEMSLMANAKFELFRDAKLQVFYDVQKTWYELYKIRKGISISEKNIEILKTIERLALVRFKSGPVGGDGTTSIRCRDVIRFLPGHQPGQSVRYAVYGRRSGQHQYSSNISTHVIADRSDGFLNRRVGTCRPVQDPDGSR